MGVVVVKKLLSFLLTAALVLSFLPLGLLDMTASAATSGTTGECTWSLNGTVLTISGNGETGSYNNSRYDHPWGTDITEVIIGPGVTKLGDQIFSYCKKLKRVSISDTVEIIGEYTFSDCIELKNIIIPQSVTYIGKSAFVFCTRLESLIIPDSVTYIGDGAFAGCKGLKNIKLSNSITTIEDGTFHTCESLTELIIPDSVTSIDDDAIRDCKSLTSIRIPDSVKSIGTGLFYGCSGLTNVILPSNLTTIGLAMFSGCTSLKSITIPEGVTTFEHQIFEKCTALESIYIPKNVTSIASSAFVHCDSRKNIVVDKANKVYHSAGNCLIKTDDKMLVRGFKSSVIPSDGTVTRIGDSAFGHLEDLTDITIPDSVTDIGKYVFYKCTRLKRIVIPDSIKKIDRLTFAFCDELASVIIPESVTEIDEEAFFCCPKVKIRTTEGSTADKFAKANNIPVSYSSEQEDASLNKPGTDIDGTQEPSGVSKEDVIEVSADDGTFNKDAELKTEEIAKDSPEFDSAKKILNDICKEFTLYSISATLNGSGVQPNGKVKVKFAVPEGYGSNISVNVINADGTYRTVDSILSEDGSFITAELDTLGSIAICKLNASAGNDGSSDSSTDRSANTSSQPAGKEKSGSYTWLIVLIVVVVVAAAGVGIFFVMKKKKA